MVIEPGNSGVGRGINSTSSSSSSKTRHLDSNSEASTTDSPKGENVSLSAEAKILNQLESTLQNLPEVDVDRVASIKQAIADGSYKVNADVIAENFISQDGLFD